MANKGRKILATALSAVMAFSMMNITALAAENSQETNQIGSYYTYNAAAQTWSNAGTASSVTSGNFSLTKSIAQTSENNFDVTLKVETSQTVTKKDAAVMLIIDTSGSMAWCANCGKAEDKHSSEWHAFVDEGTWRLSWGGWYLDNTPDGKCDVCDEDVNSPYHHAFQSRISAAIAEAKAFVAKLNANAANNPGVKIYVSAVRFSGADDTIAASTICNWTDVSTGTGLTAVQNSFSGLTAKGGTNLEAGLELAKNRLSMTQTVGTASVDFSKLTNKYTVLLTDGEPTAYCGGKTSTSTGTITDYDNDGDGSACSEKERSAAATMATALKTQSKLYTICYGVSGDTLYTTSGDPCAICGNNKENHFGKNKNYCYQNDKNNRYTPTETTVTVGDYLGTQISSGTGYAYNANNLADLDTAFSSIATSAISGINGGGTTVTDPMGSNIVLGDVSGLSASGVTTSGGGLLWTLDPAKASTATSGGKTTYTYTVTYPITLNNLNSGVAAGTFYKTNGPTYLTVPASGTTAEQKLYFNVPSVKGLAGTLSFTKKAAYDGHALANAVFALADSTGTYQASATSNSSGVVTFSNIPSGHTYTLTETTAPANYLKNSESETVTVSYGAVTTSGSLIGSDNTVADELDPQNQTFTVKKVWLPSGTATQAINASIYSYTLVNGEKVLDASPAATVELNTGNSFTNTATLPTVDTGTGNTITYTVTEAPKDGSANYNLVSSVYTAETHTFTLTNVSNAKQTLTIQKNWVAPDSAKEDVTVRLYQNNVKYGEDFTLTANKEWKDTVEVPSFDDAGNAYSYTVAEIVPGENGTEQAVTSGTVTIGDHQYKVSVSGTTVTNTIVQEYTGVSGTKTWNVAALSSAEKAALSATVKLTGSNNTTNTAAVTVANPNYSFTNLPKYDLTNGGAEITYTVEETAVSNSKVVKSGEAENSTNGKDFVNTLTDTVDITVTKVWQDNNDAEKVRPTSVDVKVTGSDGESYETTLGPGDASAASSGSDEALPADSIWTTANSSHKFEDLPKYDSTGALITYTVEEEGLESGKLTAGDLYYVPTIEKSGNTYTITNTLGGSDKTITLSKTWIDDKSNTDRTAQAVITLTGSDNNVYTWTTSKTETTLKTVPAFTSDGTEITYTAAETTVPAGYTSSANGFSFTNTLNQISDVTVSGKKIWAGSGNHPTATFTLYKNGTATDQSISTTDDNYSDSGFSFTGLDRYTFEDGACRVNTYDIRETMSGSTALLARYGYSGSPIIGTKNDSGVYVFTNTFRNADETVSGTKTWIGGSGTAKVGIYKVVGDTETFVSSTTTAADGSFSFTVPTYTADGLTLSYKVYEMNGETKVANGGEIAIGGKTYVVSYTDKNITNTLKQDFVTTSVTKVWAGPKASSAKFELLRDGSRIGSGVFLTLTAKNADENGNWVGSFPEQEKYKANRVDTYAYTVSEVDENNRDVAMSEGSGSVTLEGKTYTVTQTGSVIVNTIVDPKNGTFTVSKKWVNVPEQTTPSEIQVRLYADGAATDMTAVLNSDNSWKSTFTGLNVYNGATPVTYSAKEIVNGSDVDSGAIQIDGVHYNVSTEGGVITNTWTSTEKYSYVVVLHYTKDGTTLTPITGTSVIGAKDESVSFDASGSVTYQGVTYKFVKNTVAATGTDSNKVTGSTGTDPKFSVSLGKYNDSDNSYQVDLYFTYTSTSPTPTPGGGSVVVNPPSSSSTPSSSETTISEEPTPTASLPAESTSSTASEAPAEIPDDNVPKAEAPQTGDAMGLWITLLAVSGASLAWLVISGKKKRSADSQNH